jgi:hypothetical protein
MHLVARGKGHHAQVKQFLDEWTSRRRNAMGATDAENAVSENGDGPSQLYNL